MIENQDIKQKNNAMPTEAELNQLRKLIDEFLQNKTLIPPIHQNKLFALANTFIELHVEFAKYSKLIAILINNYAWQNVVAAIPYNKRVLLLPKCIQNTDKCNAKIDELGLLCELCGSCKLTDYISTAEKLGYNVIVSEGSGAVSVLLNSGQIECVVGVACLESFERTFPISLKHAIPSIAIPLYNSNCKNSNTNEPWLKQTLLINNKNSTIKHIELNKLKTISDNWFSNDYINKLFPPNDKSTEIANKWLRAGGKRWRPLILSALVNSLSDEPIHSNESLAKLAIAIESFHKASLAHDDIVDNDTERYGKDSLFAEQSLGITLNTGDLLLSYGYQLIAQSGLSALQIQKLIQVAAKGHGELCLGQGEELLWQQQQKMPSIEKVIEIFSLKTAPAFEVSLLFAAIFCDASESINNVITNYSQAIGIAYQIKDDIDDFNPENINNDIHAYRPSLILAILNEKFPNKMLVHLGQKNNGSLTTPTDIYNWANKTGAITEAQNMLDFYKNKALNALGNLQDVSVKILLYRLVNKILT